MFEHREQPRRGANGLCAGDDLQHAIGPLIAALRNDSGIDQARRHIKTQARAGPIEKLRRADRSGIGSQHRLVQSAALTSSASAIAKNSPPDATPNMGLPSTTRSSPMSTRA